MIIKLTDGECRIRFQYLKSTNKKYGTTTVCHCEVRGTNHHTEAVASIKDPFIKAVGRRKALTRMLLGFRRADRKIIWSTYFSQHADLRNNKPQVKGAKA